MPHELLFGGFSNVHCEHAMSCCGCAAGRGSAAGSASLCPSSNIHSTAFSTTSYAALVKTAAQQVVSNLFQSQRVCSPARWQPHGDHRLQPLCVLLSVFCEAHVVLGLLPTCRTTEMASSSYHTKLTCVFGQLDSLNNSGVRDLQLTCYIDL